MQTQNVEDKTLDLASTSASPKNKGLVLFGGHCEQLNWLLHP